MKFIYCGLISLLLSQSICFAQEAEFDPNIEHFYTNEITFYMHFTEPGMTSYCASVDINADIKLLEAVNSSCGKKGIDYEVIIKPDYSYSLESVTNKLFQKESFTDPVFATKISAKILALTALAVTGNLKIEKAD